MINSTERAGGRENRGGGLELIHYNHKNLLGRNDGAIRNNRKEKIAENEGRKEMKSANKLCAVCRMHGSNMLWQREYRWVGEQNRPPIDIQNQRTTLKQSRW